MAKLIDLKKLVYPINDELKAYLESHQRAFDLPLEYKDLTRYTSTMALYDSNDEDTLWTTVGYDATDREEIHIALLQIYALFSIGKPISNLISP